MQRTIYSVLAIAIVRSIVGLREGVVVSPVPQMPGVVTPASADGQAVLGLPYSPVRPASWPWTGRGDQ